MAGPSQSVLAAFERFFAAYPRRPENPKAAARQVFVKLAGAGEDPEALVRAAGAYAAFCRGHKKDPSFVPHARTWLHQRRFEDFLEVDAPASAAPAQPSPEHPLAWLAETIGDESWRSWVAQLQVEVGDDQATVGAPTQYALNHVRSRWGELIQARLGQVLWTITPKERP